MEQTPSFEGGAKGSVSGDGARFAAFISYRHAEPDRRWAKWLHRALETYRIPRKLALAHGLPSRIGTIFRDEDELPASADLSQEINSALDQSRFLIVVCSPRTPASAWINEEVKRFRRLGRDNRILAMLIEGEPGASFPAALIEIRRTAIDAAGVSREEIEAVEPLAADVRASRSDRPGHLRRMARMRLAACLLGVRFDELRQREQERRFRRFVAVTGVLALLLVMMAGLTVFALLQRGEANRQRTAAELRRTEAETSDRIARRRLADIYARDGWGRVAAGDPSVALLWFVRSLEVLKNDPSAEAFARLRLGTVMDSAPRLLRVSFGARDQSIAFGTGRQTWPSIMMNSGREKYTVQLVDPDKKRPTIVLRHEGIVISATINSERSKIVTASRDKTARIWDIATGRELTPPLRHDDTVNHAEFSRDGARILTCSDDKTARLWDATSGALIGQPIRHEGAVRRAQFSADGSKVVTASADHTARVWDGRSGVAVTPPLRHDDVVGDANFDADGLRVVTASQDKTARVWDARTGQALTAPLRHPLALQSAQFSPDGKRILTACFDRAVRQWNARDGSAYGPALDHPDMLIGNHFNPDDEKEIYVASNDAVVRIWDAGGGQPRLAALTHPHGIYWATFSADGRRIATAGLDGARVWDAGTSLPLTPLLKHEGAVRAVAFSVDGKRLATVGADRKARVWDAATGVPVTAPLEHDEDLYLVAFSPDGSAILTGGSAAINSSGGKARITHDCARLWDAASGQPLGPAVRSGDGTLAVAFPSGAPRVITSGADHIARVWDAKTGQVLPTALFQHAQPIIAAAFTDDGTKLVTGCMDSSARVWDVGSGQPLTNPMRHDSGGLAPIFTVAFSADGSKIVTGSGDFTARVWDANTGKSLAPPMMHAAYVQFVAFSRDGSKIVTASWDNTARVWDTATGQPLTPPLRHHAVVAHAEFSPEGDQVVTAGNDGIAQVWDLRPTRLAIDVCRKFAELLASQHLDDSDNLRPIAGRPIERLFQELNGNNPSLFVRSGTSQTAPATRPGQSK